MNLDDDDDGNGNGMRRGSGDEGELKGEFDNEMKTP